MWYWIFSQLFYVIFRIFFRLKIEGLENIPKKGNFIIISNHNSFLDPAVIMASIPKKICCIAIRDIYQIRWLNWFLRVTETLPSGSSSQKAIELLHKNKNIGLFPEGGVSRTGKLKEFRKGTALLALKTGRPIVPCAVFGTHESLPLGAKLPRFISLKLKIGKPIFLLKEAGEIIDDILLQKETSKIRNIIKELLNAR